MYILFCGWFIFPFTTNLLMCARRWRWEGQFCGGETRHLRVALVGRGRPEDAAKCRRMSWLQMACRHLWMIITMMNNHRIITIIVIILMIITVIWMIIYWYYDHGMKNDEQSTIQWWTEVAIWSYGYPYSLDIPEKKWGAQELPRVTQPNDSQGKHLFNQRKSGLKSR